MTKTEAPPTPVQILLVEDSAADVELTRQGLLDGRVANRLHVVADGEDALAFVRREGDHADAPRPDLVLLDLNLPRKDGREVLAELKDDPDLCDIPVVVLTTSAADRDVLHTYRLHANSYITKPVAFDRFVEVIREITGYWFHLVKLPRPK